jgi:hypothetical protein
MLSYIHGVAQDKLQTGRSGSMKPPVSVYSSSISDGRSSSRDSTTCHAFAIHRRSIKERYLHRLGISALPIEHQLERSNSAPAGIERMTDFNIDNESLNHSSAKQEDNRILLRRSEQYTTKLKTDPNEENPNCSEPICSSRRTSLFELSWASFVLNESTRSALSSTETLDGAYDLFSLPSDISLSFSRSKSLDTLDTNTTAPIRKFSSSDELSVSTQQVRRVSFDSTVQTTTIPSRHDYSKRIKSRIWSSTLEIYTNGVRNAREFEYDGKNWRTASEEDDFLCCESAEQLHLVHPVHLYGLPNQQLEFEIQEEEEEKVFDDGILI